MTRKEKKRRADICAASAALAFNLLPGWMKLSEHERYERLRAFCAGILNAYNDLPEEDFHLPEFSQN